MGNILNYIVSNNNIRYKPTYIIIDKNDWQLIQLSSYELRLKKKNYILKPKRTNLKLWH